MNQNFRFAINGFNRSDVIAYLEYLNKKHTEKVNQLTLDNEILRQQLRAPESEITDVDLKELADQVDMVIAERNTLMARVSELEKEKASAPAPDPQGVARELEAYRRAEQTEREAKEHAQAVRTLTEKVVEDACAQAQAVIASYEDVTRRANDAISALLAAVEELRKIKMD